MCAAICLEIYVCVLLTFQSHARSKSWPACRRWWGWRAVPSPQSRTTAWRRRPWRKPPLAPGAGASPRRTSTSSWPPSGTAEQRAALDTKPAPRKSKFLLNTFSTRYQIFYFKKIINFELEFCWCCNFLNYYSRAYIWVSRIHLKRLNDLN